MNLQGNVNQFIGTLGGAITGKKFLKNQATQIDLARANAMDQRLEVMPKLEEAESAVGNLKAKNEESMKNMLATNANLVKFGTQRGYSKYNNPEYANKIADSDPNHLLGKDKQYWNVVHDAEKAQEAHNNISKQLTAAQYQQEAFKERLQALDKGIYGDSAYTEKHKDDNKTKIL